ncbi:MAG: YitT family protein [Pseudomonadota bacterium]
MTDPDERRGHVAGTGKPAFLPFYDAQGLAFGILMASMGVTFLKAAGLVTGQTAGLAVLISYMVPMDFGVIFMAISLPFIALAWAKRGAVFTVRTAIAVAGIAVLTPVLSQTVQFASIPGLLAAILGGASAGVGLIALFRHNASAGGLGILALLVEQRTGLKAGWFQMGFDAVVFALAFLALDVAQVAYSFAGAIVLNAIIAWNFHVGQAGAPNARAPDTGKKESGLPLKSRSVE